MLLIWLERTRKINRTDDSDGLKHLTSPPTLEWLREQGLSLAPNFRIVFVSGPGPDSILSLFRRDFASHHCYKTTGQPFLGTLEDYLKSDGDPLALHEIFLNWVKDQKNLEYPIYHLRYEDIWDNSDWLDFLGLNDAERARLPQKKLRESDKLSSGDTQRLEQKFVQFEIDRAKYVGQIGQP